MRLCFLNAIMDKERNIPRLGPTGYGEIRAVPHPLLPVAYAQDRQQNLNVPLKCCKINVHIEVIKASS